MNRFFSILIILFFAVTLNGKPVTGVVQSKGDYLENVVVTDGYTFTKSDQNGHFKLDVNPEAGFVYIFTPTGYTPVRVNGISQFFKKIEQSTDKVVFELEPTGCRDYALIAVGDPQTKTAEQFDLFEKRVLPDIKATVDNYAKMGIYTVTLYLGDVVWDSMSLFNNHKEAINRLEAPVYAAIGNHDHQRELKGDKLSGTAFGDCFGPAYYGFNLGNNYIIVLDNIVYDTNKLYVEDVTQQQVDWLKGYLGFIPENANVYIAMHAPVGRFWIEGFKPSNGHQQILDLFSGRKLSFITGHTHINSNLEVIPGVIEHNVASSCGAFWKLFYTMDGTPSGYQIFEMNEKNPEWYFKTIGKGRDFQMELYPVGAFTIKPDAIVAKVWNWDPEWRVEWYQDGRYMGAMEQFKSIDPKYQTSMQELVKEGQVSQSDFEKGNYLKPRTTFFFFAAVPDKDAKEIKVVATDRFGKKYNDTILLIKR